MQIVKIISIPKDKKIKSMKIATEKAISQMTKKYGLDYHLLSSREKVDQKKMLGLKKKIIYEFKFSYEEKKKKLKEDFIDNLIGSQEKQHKTKNLNAFKGLISNKQRQLGINQGINDKQNNQNFSRKIIVTSGEEKKIVDNFSGSSSGDFSDEVSVDNSRKNKKNIDSYWVSLLKDYDFSGELIDFILQQASNLKYLKKEEVYQRISKIIAENLNYYSTLKKYDSVANLVILLGPTGVGKTTTLAKIVTDLHIEKKNRVLICSFDSIKLGAFAQLKAFAEVTEVDILDIHDEEELLKVYHENKNNYDYIFIDSPGISSKDNERLEEMNSALKKLNCKKETYLCISASWRYRDLKKIVASFITMNCDAFIITKLDESSTLGAVVSLSWEKKIPIAFLTDSQEITSSYEIGNSEILFSKLQNDFLSEEN